MNLHSERTELLPTSFHRSTNRAAAGSTTNASTTIQSHLHADDKDSIYTFSNDESDFMDNNGKFGSRLSSAATTMNAFSSTMDKNLNDTRNFGLKSDSIRTYSKKKASSSTSPAAITSPAAAAVNTVSLRNERKRSLTLAATTTTTTTYSDTPSCSPLQSLSSVPLSPFSDESNPQSFKSNGSAQIGKYGQIYFDDFSILNFFSFASFCCCILYVCCVLCANEQMFLYFRSIECIAEIVNMD